jgi:hypothetical protein
VYPGLDGSLVPGEAAPLCGVSSVARLPTPISRTPPPLDADSGKDEIALPEQADGYHFEAAAAAQREEVIAGMPFARVPCGVPVAPM